MVPNLESTARRREGLLVVRWTDKDIVEGLYRGILNREGDPVGMAAHLRYLSDRTDMEALAEMASSFVQCQEFIRRLNAAQFTPVRHGMLSAPKIEEEPISYVMSVGSSCSTSSMLERWGLRHFAGPFDWIFSSMHMVHHVLYDDFRTFLDRDQMVPVMRGKDIAAVQHPFYVPFAQYVPGHEGAPIFLHHDPLGKHHEHFVRSAERTRHALAGRTLLVGVYRDAPNAREIFGALSSYLSSAAPLTRLMAFIVAPVEGALMPELGLLDSSGHHHLYLIRSLDGLNEHGFANFYDEMTAMRAAHQYRFDLKPL